MNDDLIKAMAADVVEKHAAAVISLLFGNKYERATALNLLDWAGKKGMLYEMPPIIRESPGLRTVLSDHYKKYWEMYDCHVRFEEGHKKEWADFLKMVTFGMSKEELEEETKRRGPWIPLNEKRKGHY